MFWCAAEFDFQAHLDQFGCTHRCRLDDLSCFSSQLESHISFDLAWKYLLNYNFSNILDLLILFQKILPHFQFTLLTDMYHSIVLFWPPADTPGATDVLIFAKNKLQKFHL